MDPSKPKILFISHDANRAGAQLFLLNIMKDFKASGYSMELLCLVKWGPLLEEFEAVCTVKGLPQQEDSGRIKRLFSKGIENRQIEYIKSEFRNGNFDLIYANTIASAQGALMLKEELNVPLITHIHELQFSLDLYANEVERNKLLTDSEGIIACSQAVSDNLIKNDPRLKDKTTVIHSFVDNEAVLNTLIHTNSRAIKEEFGIPQNTYLVGACGNAEWRKGLDVFINFVAAAQQDQELKDKVHFVWIGVKKEGEYFDKIAYDVAKMGIGNSISFIAPTPKAIEIINSLDVFLVSSREDPFPLVMLEAALCEKPILGFEKSGGCGEFVKDSAGLLTEYLNIQGLVENLKFLRNNPDLSSLKGQTGKKQVLELYNFDTSVIKLKKYLANFGS